MPHPFLVLATALVAVPRLPAPAPVLTPAHVAPVADTLTLAAVRAVYPRVFRFPLLSNPAQPGRFGAAPTVDTLPAAHPLAGFVNRNYHLLLYLALYAPRESFGDALRSASDSSRLRQHLDARLAGDSAFDRAFVGMASRYLAARGGAVRGASPAPRRRVTMDEAARLAARFFYPDSVRPDGTIQSHICVGLNGVADAERGRDPELEAFAYSAIFAELLLPTENLERTDYAAAKRLVQDLGLSTDPTVKLRRAQGVMWAVMAQSERLRHVLRREYTAKATYLPFELVDEPATSARE